MTNSRSTKRSLLMSVVALMLCFTMLLGTTFAWFTDSVVSNNNIIKSGNLDISLEYWDGTDWKDVTGASDILTGDLWEPGYVDVAYLRIKNEGSLALKYQLGVNIVSEQDGLTPDGETITLSDYIYFDVVEGVDGKTAAYQTRDEALAVTTEKTLISEGYTKAASLDAGSDYVYLAMIVYMPIWIGNEANHDGTNVPKIDLGIKVAATQMTTESDAFDNSYDGGAVWYGGIDLSWYDPDATEYTISNPEQLAGLAAIVNGTAVSPITTFAATEPATLHDNFKDKTIKLNSDLDLADISWTPIGRIGTTSTDFDYSFKGTFDGQNHTVHNLNVSNTGWAGLFGIAHSAEIKNLKISGVTIESNRMAGAVVGQLYGSIVNCHVEDAEINVVPNVSGSSYDNGDKVGGIVGWLGDNGNNRVLSDSSATNVTIKAYRDVGGIAGYVASSTLVKNNTATGYNITVDQRVNNYGYKDINAGAIMGRLGGTVTDENNVSLGEGNVIRAYYIKNGVVISEGSHSEDVTLYSIPADYSDSKLVIPEGVTALGSKILNGNKTIKEVVVPSSVEKFGGKPNDTNTGASGGFFYNSAVEKVTLPEGITEIPVAMFNQATKLKEVNIPSSVTTIGINAFAGSGLSTLHIPSTVTSIGYGAFRDMDNLTTVTIEGDEVHIPGYAFRDCSNLTTIYLKVNKLTLGDGMIFTNTSTNNENPNNITIYVYNDDVFNTLKANADVKANVVKAVEVTEDTLNSNLTNGATVILPEGDYTLPSLSEKVGVTIIGGEGAVIGGENATTGYGSNFGKNTTIKNVTFKGSSNGVRYSYANGGTSTFDNCTFHGDSTYGFHIDESNGATFIFNNCTFIGFNAFAGDLEKVVFNNCTFLHNGNYGHTNIWSVAEFNNCTWGDKASVSPAGGGTLYFNGVEESYHHEYIGSAESLFTFATSVNEGNDSWNGQKVILINDIDLENALWTPIGQTGATEFKGIFDGQNYTIYNLNIDSSAQVDGYYSSGLFGWNESGATIQNVKIDGASVVGNHNVGVIVGYTYSSKIINCHVSNADVVCNHANDDACGDKCGIIVGYAGDDSVISDCSATDCTVKAGRDAGQLVGCGYNVSLNNCSATNVTVTATGDCTGKNINESLIGRVMD